jgi:hypothetical protein
MAARKKVTKRRTTTKTAPKRAKAKAKVKTKPKARAKAAPRKATRAKASAKRTTKVAAKTSKKTIAAKPAARATAKATPAKAKPAKAKPAKAKPATNGPTSRRDATGHLNPKYAADLRARSRESAEDLGNDNAFLRKARSHDTLAEELGEDAVKTMTSGEDQSDRMQDLEVDEENGGPFITTSGREEFAGGTDKSNPFDATREPFPTS